MSDYWKDNGIKKPQAIIVCAAVKYEEHIFTGARHYDKIMNQQMKMFGLIRKSILIDGFINQFGEFLDRGEAMQVAKESGQPLDLERNGGNDLILFSEGLY